MKKILKISIILFILILSLSLVSATENNSDTNHNKLTKNSNDNYYTVSPNGKGVGKTDGNLFETLDYTEKNNQKATINLKNGTYNFKKEIINGTYYSNRRLGKYNVTKSISFIGNNTILNADNCRFFNIQKGVTAEFINIKFTNGYSDNGGSIYNEGNLILKNCSFINSSAFQYGGAISIRGNNTIENTQFINSSIKDSTYNGGVVYIFKSNQTFMNNVSFINNTDNTIHSNGPCNLSITNSEFKNNINYYELFCENSKNYDNYITVNNTKFINNTVSATILSDNGNNKIYLQNSTFINNTYEFTDSEILIPLININQIKNNTYIGNNFTSNITGKLSNSIVYKTPLKGILRVVPNKIYNTTINTGKASIYVDNKFYGNYGVFDGYIYVTINGLSKGKHVINVKYSDNTNSFRPSEKLFNVIVDDKILSKVISGDKYAYAGSKITFNASVFDNNNKPITTGRMVIKINGITESSITLKNTNKITFNYTVPNYTAKNYKLQYIYVGDDKIARYEANKTLHILNQSARINTNDVICYHDQIAQVNVRLVGEKTGIPVEDGIIGLQFLDTNHVNDFPIISQKVKNGRATFNYKIPKSMKASKYNILLIYFGGRNIQESSTGYNTLTLKDHTTIINIETKKLTQSKTNLIFVEVKDSNGNIESGRATMKIGSDTVSETAINNGQAIFSYYVPTYYLGKYNMTITAKGTYTDQNSSKTTITVVK